jgi:hypothetical protein
MSNGVLTLDSSTSVGCRLKHIWADCNPSNPIPTSDLDILPCDFSGSSISGVPPSVCPVYVLPRLQRLVDPNMDILLCGSVLSDILTLAVTLHQTNA